MENRTKPAEGVSGQSNESFSFLEDEELCAYEYFGLQRNGDCFVVRAHAPDCDALSLVGDFNGWSPEKIPMQKNAAGIWETVLSADTIKNGQNYKFFAASGGEGRFLSDPFARETEIPPGSASVVCDASPYDWRDNGWRSFRAAHFCGERARRQPINAYRVDLDAWNPRDGAPEGLDVQAERLSVYVKQMGYTHVELNGINPCTASSDGDRLGSFYAPDARLGTPRKLRAFIDCLHEAGIGVLLDLPADVFEFGLSVGQPVSPICEAEASEAAWSTVCFWAREYHVDGICFIFSEESEISLVERVSQRARTELPDLILSALRAKPDLSERYASDAFLNERVGLLVTRARETGDVSLERLLRFCRMTLPGKKRTVTGREFAPFLEEGGAVPWPLLKEDMHASFQLFTARLNHFYLKEPTLWERDGDTDTPVSLALEDDAVFGFLRKGSDEKSLAVLINPSGESREGCLAFPSGKCVFSVGEAPVIYTEGECLRVRLSARSGCVLAV